MHDKARQAINAVLMAAWGATEYGRVPDCKLTWRMYEAIVSKLWEPSDAWDAREELEVAERWLLDAARRWGSRLVAATDLTLLDLGSAISLLRTRCGGWQPAPRRAAAEEYSVGTP